MVAPKKPNSLENVKAVVFDFDGTLAVLNLDFGVMREQVFNLLKVFGVHEEMIKERYLLEIIDEAYPILEERSPSDAMAFYQKAHQILQEIELTAAGEGRTLPGTERMLMTLREKGVKVGIVTRNCEDAVRRVFPNIDEYCDVFISRNSIKKVKPHPDHLTSAMKALNVNGEEAVMVGDHILDIQAGKAVGMKTVGVLTGRTKREEFEKAGADCVLTAAPEICTLWEKEPADSTRGWGK